MADEKFNSGLIHLKCVCGGDLHLDPELLGRTFPCPHCDRYLRAALQFLLIDRELAPNTTVLCTCGRFIVGGPESAGKVSQCVACGQRVILPDPVMRQTEERVVRVPPRALERQLRRMQGRRGWRGGDVGRLRRAGHWGRINLRPGQEVCINPECGAPMPAGGRVCQLCGTNVVTGIRYEGPGPEGDPLAKWKQP